MPKPTVGVALLVSVDGVAAAGFPKVIGDDSAGFGAVTEGEPKLNPPLVEVSFFCGESVAGLVAPNEKPPEPKVAGFGSSFFSVDLLSVVSVAGFAPKLNPVEAGVVAVVLLLLPNENLGLSSELGAVVAAGLLPKEKPPEVGAVAVELEAGTPKENPDFGASLLESASFGTPKLNPELVVPAAVGLLPNEKDGVSDGVEPGLACSQQMHLLRVASLRVMQALHSHLPADCCATKLLKPWSDGGLAVVVVVAGIANIDLMAAGTAEATAAAAGFAPGFGLLQQRQLLLSASLRVMQSAHSHRADCCATRALKPASAGAAVVNGFTTAAAATGFAPGLGVSHATHLLLSGSFRTIQASHSHLLEPDSLNAPPNPPADGGFSASKQLPLFNSGTAAMLLFSASKQLPLLSGSGAFTGLTSFEAAATNDVDLTFAVSGLNWKPVSFVGMAAAPFPIGSGLLNLKLLSVAGFEVGGRFSFAGEENL